MGTNGLIFSFLNFVSVIEKEYASSMFFFFLEIFGAGKLQKLVKTKERGIFGT